MPAEEHSKLSSFIPLLHLALPAVVWIDNAVAGYWEALHLLAQHPQLPAFAGLQALLPRLAEHGQYLLLACALGQVCSPLFLPLQAIIRILRLGKAAGRTAQARLQAMLWSGMDNSCCLAA